MTTKFVQHGEVIDYQPPADVHSNDVIAVGSLVGVAAADIPANQIGALIIEGVFDLPKVAGAAITVGQKLNWIAASAGFGAAAAGAGGVTGAAVAVAPAASADTVVRVKLCPGAGAPGT